VESEFELAKLQDNNTTITEVLDIIVNNSRDNADNISTTQGAIKYVASFISGLKDNVGTYNPSNR
jgi:hypothetical protein